MLLILLTLTVINTIIIVSMVLALGQAKKQINELKKKQDESN